MSTDLARTTGNGVAGFDRDAILRALNLNPSDAKTQALLVVCDRYNLDPLLKHMVLIQGSPYVTRDGYLHVAHRSGALDGIEVIETGETQTHYTAKVAVYRKDMSRPFVFVGRYPKGKQMAKEYGPEMAIKVAEVQSLRRAFNVTGVSAADEMWAEDVPAESGVERRGTAHVDAASPAAPTATTRRPPPNIDPDTGEVRSTIPAQSTESKPFDDSDVQLADAVAVRSWVKEVKAAGFDEAVTAAIIHRATRGRTDIPRAVLATEWERVGIVYAALLDGKLAESVEGETVRLVVVAETAEAAS